LIYHILSSAHIYIAFFRNFFGCSSRIHRINMFMDLWHVQTQRFEGNPYIVFREESTRSEAGWFGCSWLQLNHDLLSSILHMYYMYYCYMIVVFVPVTVARKRMFPQRLGIFRGSSKTMPCPCLFCHRAMVKTGTKRSGCVPLLPITGRGWRFLVLKIQRLSQASKVLLDQMVSDSLCTRTNTEGTLRISVDMCESEICFLTFGIL
jgi:hypothetical protein